MTCHNRKEKTLNCLTNLFNQNGLISEFLIEVFLVDDASIDGTKEEIKAQFPLVNIIEGNGNLFWNRGMYLAWRTAIETREFDFFLWLNDDTFLYKNAISILVQSAKETQSHSVICGSTYSNDEKRISYGGITDKSNLLVPNNTLQEANTFNGNCVLIPKHVCEKVGILDNRFPHAIGDFEYGLRVRKYGLKAFVAKEYIGVCEGFKKLPIWCSSNVPFSKRLKNLYSPLGSAHPYFFFIYEKSYYGVLYACKHFITIHLRLIFPSLWSKRIK